MVPTALTINTSYLNLDKVLLSKHETYLPNFVEKCYTDSRWSWVVDRFIMSNMKLTIPPTWKKISHQPGKKYPTNLEKTHYISNASPKLQPTVDSRLFCGFMGSDTHNTTPETPRCPVPAVGTC